MSDAALAALPAVVVAFLATAIAAFILTPLAIRFAGTVRAVDVPTDERRVHSSPVARTGGLAVAAAFVGVGAIGLVLNEIFGWVPLRAVRGPQLFGLLGGVGVGAIVGYLDDRLQLRARWQLGGQLVLAAIAIASGVIVDNIVNPLGGSPIRFDGAVAAAVTALWFVGMLNSTNFIDGLDGLLAGIAIVAAVTLGIVSLVGAPPIQPFVAVLCALLAGSLAGFLPYNFYPARVFLGTAGVFAIGYALGVLAILGVAKVAVALLVLGVPIVDAFWVIIRRVVAGRAPFAADRGHIHHRLLDLGLSHRSAVLVLYTLCIVLALLSLILAGDARLQLLSFAVIVLGAGFGLLLIGRRTRPEQAVGQERP